MEVFGESVVERYIDAGLNGYNISFNQTTDGVGMIFCPMFDETEIDRTYTALRSLVGQS